jgi:ParB family chromosome partitioning protein
MGKLSFVKDPSRTAINNSPEKAVGISLGLDDITKAEPFASLFDIRGDTLEAIKADMKANGFDPSKPVNVWRKPDGTRILIDGYTRVQAAEAIGLLSITVYEKTFKDEAEALAYAIHTQKDRRNLSDAELLRLIERLDKPIKGFKGARGPDEEKPIETASAPIASREAIGGKPRKTAEKTAEALGVSRSTIERARVVLKDPKKRAAVLEGKQSIAKAAQDAKAKSSPPSGARKAPAATMKALRATIERQIKQLEKQINAEGAKAAAATKATGRQSRDYLTGHAEGLAEALALANRLRELVK